MRACMQNIFRLVSGQAPPLVKAGRCKGGHMVRWLVGTIALGVLAIQTSAAAATEIGVGYLHRPGIKSTLSLIAQPAEDAGVAGARLAIEDNNTTGKFLNQHFSLQEIRLKDGDDAAQAAVTLAD